jgi:hypothetical protein
MVTPKQYAPPDLSEPEEENSAPCINVVVRETDDAQEWGSGLDHGRSIARGGKTDGFVAGATEQQN